MLHQFAAFTHVIVSMIGHALSIAGHTLHADAGKADLINWG